MNSLLSYQIETAMEIAEYTTISEINTTIGDCKQRMRHKTWEMKEINSRNRGNVEEEINKLRSEIADDAKRIDYLETYKSEKLNAIREGQKAYKLVKKMYSKELQEKNLLKKDIERLEREIKELKKR